MKTYQRVIVAGLLAAVLSACGDPASMVGATAPDFEVESLQSKELKTTLKSYAGKVVILDFWATWCGPCKMILPFVEQTYHKYEGQGVVAMAISSESRDVVAAAEVSEPHHMPVYIDAFSLAKESYNASSIPVVIVVGRDGKIVYDTRGFSSAVPKELDDAVKKAIG